jgi:hypothetical protein
MQLIFIYAIFPAVVLAVINSWYWYTQGYRGGKLLFLGILAFYGIFVLIGKLFFT